MIKYLKGIRCITVQVSITQSSLCCSYILYFLCELIEQTVSVLNDIRL